MTSAYTIVTHPKSGTKEVTITVGMTMGLMIPLTSAKEIKIQVSSGYTKVSKPTGDIYTKVSKPIT